jgi:membrane protein
LFTSFLFSIGKVVLHVLLTYNNVTTIYGASASVVLLLLFVFYFSMILYYGASFTKVLGDAHAGKNHLSDNSIHTGA